MPIPLSSMLFRKPGEGRAGLLTLLLAAVTLLAFAGTAGAATRGLTVLHNGGSGTVTSDPPGL